MSALTSISEADAAAKAVADGVLAGADVRAVTISQVSDDGELLHTIGMHGLPSVAIERLSLAQSARRPATQIGEAFRDGRDLVGLGSEIHRKYPLGAIGLIEAAAGRPTVSHALVLRRGGVPIGVLTCAIELEQERVVPLELLDGVRSAISLWLPHRRNAQSLPGAGPTLISARQGQILRMASEGRPNAAIARALGYSEATIKADLTTLYRLTGATSRVDLLRLAEAAGLIDRSQRPVVERLVSATTDGASPRG